jgi:Domain of unknown function (DUF4381)
MSAAPADPTSLENLHDIITPPPVPWWPPAPVWYVLGGIALVLAVWAGWRGWRRWQAAAYRRAALTELQRLKARTADDAQRGLALQELPALVKRTALAAFPRQAVASLSSTAWLEFLDHTGHTCAFTNGRGQLLPALSYDPHAASRLDAQEVEELFSVVSGGIRHHSIAPEVP